MATVKSTDGQELTKEERVAVLMAMGMTRTDAEFTVALEDGEIDGDVIEVSESRDD